MKKGGDRHVGRMVARMRSTCVHAYNYAFFISVHLGAFYMHKSHPLQSRECGGLFGKSVSVLHQVSHESEVLFGVGGVRIRASPRTLCTLSGSQARELVVGCSWILQIDRHGIGENRARKNVSGE